VGELTSPCVTDQTNIRFPRLELMVRSASSTRFSSQETT
jgi:hypothetical protein